MVYQLLKMTQNLWFPMIQILAHTPYSYSHTGLVFIAHVVDTFNLGNSNVLLCRLVAAMAKKDTKETKDGHIL